MTVPGFFGRLAGPISSLIPSTQRMVVFPAFAQITNPDLGLQLSICVNSVAEQAIGQVFRTALTTPMNVGGRMISLLPPSTPLDIRSMCSSNAHRIGLWFPSAPQTNRDMWLLLPPAVLPGENYVQQVSLSGIRFVADAIWANPMTPKRFPVRGLPDAHLTSFSINLAPPNRIITRINGFVPLPVVPDIDFHVDITDTLSLDGQGQIRCMSDPRVTTESNLLRAFLLGGIPLHVLLFTRDLLSLLRVSLRGQRGQPLDPMAGLGCQVLQALAPGGAMVQPCGQIDFPYSRLDVTSGGVVLGSRAPLHPCLLASRIMEEPFRGPR